MLWRVPWFDTTANGVYTCVAIDDTSVHDFFCVLSSSPGGNGCVFSTRLLLVIFFSRNDNVDVDVDAKGNAADGAGISRTSCPLGNPWLKCEALVEVVVAVSRGSYQCGWSLPIVVFDSHAGSVAGPEGVRARGNGDSPGFPEMGVPGNDEWASW